MTQCVPHDPETPRIIELRANGGNQACGRFGQRSELSHAAQKAGANCKHWTGFGLVWDVVTCSSEICITLYNSSLFSQVKNWFPIVLTGGIKNGTSFGQSPHRSVFILAFPNSFPPLFLRATQWEASPVTNVRKVKTLPCWANRDLWFDFEPIHEFIYSFDLRFLMLMKRRESSVLQTNKTKDHIYF